MTNTLKIYKRYIVLKLTEKSYEKRLRILSQHHGIDIDVLAQILEREENMVNKKNNAHHLRLTV